MKDQGNQFSKIELEITRITWTFIASAFFLITLFRSWVSIKHLPPDPGLEFQLLAKSDGLFEVFSSYNGYPQVLPRLISEFLNFVPLSHLTYWSTVINAIASMVCAVATTKALFEIAGIKTAILAGLVLSTAFSAHEGLVGNIWAIRWTLLPTACVIASIPVFSQKHWRFTLFLFLATGLSHAYIFIPTIIYLLIAFSRREYRDKTFVLGSTLVFLTIFQGFGYFNSSRQLRLYGENTIYWPWRGSGVFWWAVFTTPLIFALIALLANLTFRKPAILNFTPQRSMAIQAFLLSIFSYLQLGIKSSPAVATATLSFISTVVVVNASDSLANRLRINFIIKIFCSLLIVILSVRFYFPSFYLTNGEGWPETVEKSLIQCQKSDAKSTELIIFKLGDVVQSEIVPCSSLTTWDKWFFKR
jgi:hypothetical protein